MDSTALYTYARIEIVPVAEVVVYFPMNPVVPIRVKTPPPPRINK